MAGILLVMMMAYPAQLEVLTWGSSQVVDRSGGRWTCFHMPGQGPVYLVNEAYSQEASLALELARDSIVQGRCRPIP